MTLSRTPFDRDHLLLLLCTCCAVLSRAVRSGTALGRIGHLLLSLHDVSGLLECLHLMGRLLLLLKCHLLLLIYDALLNDRIDLLDGRPRIVREKDLLLARDPLLLLKPQLVHLLLLVQSLSDLLVGPGWRLRRRSHRVAVRRSWRV